MSALIALLTVIGAVLFWVWRLNNAVQTAKELDRDTKGLQRRARNTAIDIIGTKLQRVQDTRLAATILMQQLVRTGAPVTAAEKTRIMELMEQPLGIANIEQIFVRAWSYTEQNRAFMPVAEELMPLLRAKLSRDECFDLVDMLKQVANAYGEASELQAEAIDRFKRRLTRVEPDP